MRPHTRIYFDYFGYDESDFIPSELSGERAVDINHIECKGMGGNPSKDKDVIENLMAMTREEHIMYGDKVKFKPFLNAVHQHFMSTKVPYLLSKQFQSEHEKIKSQLSPGSSVRRYWTADQVHEKINQVRKDERKKALQELTTFKDKLKKQLEYEDRILDPTHIEYVKALIDNV